MHKPPFLWHTISSRVQPPKSCPSVRYIINTFLNTFYHYRAVYPACQSAPVRYIINIFLNTSQKCPCKLVFARSRRFFVFPADSPALKKKNGSRAFLSPRFLFEFNDFFDYFDYFDFFDFNNFNDLIAFFAFNAFFKKCFRVSCQLMIFYILLQCKRSEIINFHSRTSGRIDAPPFY